MNKAITDGVLLTPPVFAGGLDVWSRGNGTPGSDTYENATDAIFVPADQDFGGSLEVQKTQATQRLRYMGETPLLPGCYLQIKARVKAVSGNLPSVRIAGWAGGAGGGNVGGVIEVGPSVALTTYGEVVEVTAIVGAGARSGVDMPWGTDALYGHFGLDLTGASGGVVRIDDIEITDVTSVFLRDMLNIVDVKDYGAVGDGLTDDSVAFAAADAAAVGRKVLVPEGTYFLGKTVTFENEVVFEGSVTMATDDMLVLTKNFDLPSYIDAFKDEELAFKKAFQALLNNSDHESLDMGGRRVTVTEPIDMQAAVPNRTSYSTRRIIRNGQLAAQSGPAWDTEAFTSSATYSPADAFRLTEVANVANIPVGSLVTGAGVGREIYVRSKNIGAQTLTLSAPLFDADGTQTFTFTHFKYLLDFSGFSRLSRFAMDHIEFDCSGDASAIRLAPTGIIFALTDCFITKPKDRGVTSIGDGCQGMLIDRCQFLSNEDALPVSDRKTVAISANSNDVKLRNNRATRFKHFAVLEGSNSVIMGNHFFQGDSVPGGVRSPGLIICNSYTSATISGNYIDNCFIEWTNERDATPDFTGGHSFAAMSIEGNIFLASDVAEWFNFIVVKPHGTGHFLNGVGITGNNFRSIQGNIDRVDHVDTSIAELNFDRFKDVTFSGNSYHQISKQVQNPTQVTHNEATAAATWVVNLADELPFGAKVRRVEGIVATDAIRDENGDVVFKMPYTRAGQGANNDRAHVVWGEPVSGEVAISVRIDG